MDATVSIVWLAITFHVLDVKFIYMEVGECMIADIDCIMLSEVFPVHRLSYTRIVGVAFSVLSTPYVDKTTQCDPSFGNVFTILFFFRFTVSDLSAVSDFSSSKILISEDDLWGTFAA